MSHLYVVETLTEILLGRRDPLSTEYGYCRLTHATSNNGSFDVLLNKNYEHADQ